MIYLHFIVNPISGNGKHLIDLDLLQYHFPKGLFKVEIEYTKYKNHATELTNSAILKNPNCIIACGGDGTINEVASSLVNTDIKLGIIPVGSGNGLASHLKIPRKIEDAIAILKNGIVSKIDVGKVNSHCFFSNMGVGIDAMIIKKYEQSGNRTLLAYIKASLSSSHKFKSAETRIERNGISFMEKPFLLFISNSNEMGYTMSLTPNACLTDGKLNLLLVPQLHFSEQIRLGYHILKNTIHKFKKAKQSLIEECTITFPKKIFTDIQIDGEFHNLKTNKISVSIIKKGLNVLTAASI